MSTLADSQDTTESESREPLSWPCMHERKFSRQTHGHLANGTVRGTISYVSLSFRDNDRVNPTKDEDMELGRVLSRLFKAFCNKDTNPKPQKALPAQVLTSDDVQKKRGSSKDKEPLETLGLEYFSGHALL